MNLCVVTINSEVDCHRTWRNSVTSLYKQRYSLHSSPSFHLCSILSLIKIRKHLGTILNFTILARFLENIIKIRS